ncbi:mitochondrial ribosomal protein [Nadsonia fulvescens var. elongata DSM 6958]|uniref:37S ribosomal protein S25, mitochondrial n=1 Tax=Nadsonia fulvescens var. elongata DSM 6958 TaxID=857566 RepID=A0A1E3PPC1_9ASCO|nr:mitochondrial ribosomal protein [Nadsonia fulvescens var. elongata DSM 6958]
MKLQTKALNILETTSNKLKAGLVSQEPFWYRVVAAHPPTQNLVRKYNLIETPKITDINSSTGLFKTRNKPHYVNATTNFKSSSISFLEDKFRRIFYKQHPWELARPKLMVENDSESTCDWSSIKQTGKKLDGESVVQRARYLYEQAEAKGIVENKNDQLLKAYDQARFEFYRLRIHDEIENRIAREESEMFGAVYGQTPIEYGLGAEQEALESWRSAAIEATKLKRAKQSGPSAAGADKSD